jgi:hypothetical protein
MKRTLSLISLAVFGCTPANSNTVPTSQLEAQIQIVTDGSGQTTASASLYSHPSDAPPLNEDSIDLVDGDSLTATSDGTSLTMQESFTAIVDVYSYDATFSSDAAGESFAVTLDRAQGTSAGPSTATLPDPFALTAPASASRAQPLTVTWSPSGTSDPISVAFVGCGDAQLGPLADTGSATFPGNTLTSTTSSCAGTLTVTRSRAGALATAYGQGGSITAEQQRTASIATTP